MYEANYEILSSVLTDHQAVIYVDGRAFYVRWRGDVLRVTDGLGYRVTECSNVVEVLRYFAEKYPGHLIGVSVGCSAQSR